MSGEDDRAEHLVEADHIRFATLALEMLQVSLEEPVGNNLTIIVVTFIQVIGDYLQFSLAHFTIDHLEPHHLFVFELGKARETLLLTLEIL